MKILLTGNTGFVGSNLCAFFSEKNSAEIIKLNLRNALPLELPSANALIHLAGKAHDLKNKSSVDDYFKINTDLTKYLFDLFLDSDVADFIHFSSVKAVADTVRGSLVEEFDPSPVTPYGVSKLKAEEYILSKTLPKGKRVFIFRPCMIHGPGNKGNLNLLYKVVRNRIPYPLGAYKNRRSFLGIDNLIFVIEAVLNDLSVPGDVYNLADDESLSTTDVICIIGSAIGRKPRILNMPVTIMSALAKGGDFLSLPLNSERLKKLTESYVVDNTKIKNALGIDRFPVSATDGLLNTIKSFEN